MSAIAFTETVRNTIDVLNDIYQISDSELQFITFFKFLTTMLKDWTISIFTFQWLNDFVKFPIMVPQTTESMFAGVVFPDSNVVSLGSLNMDPLSLENASFGYAPLLAGFLNCFFLYLPFCPVHLIWLRRVIIEGELAGKTATAGLICGHLSLLGCCLFGVRDIINTWFGLEPISYLVGVWLILTVIFEMTHRPLKILKTATFQQLCKIFLINAGLVWTDQPGLYQFFGNLSVQNGVTILDVASSNSTIIWAYFGGIVVGSFVWTWLIPLGFVKFGYLFPRLTKFKYGYSHWIRGFNNFCLIGCVTLALTSFPYYGFDYLFANPLGFVPQDRVWEAVPVPKLKADTADAKKGRLGPKSANRSVDTDVSLFDRGLYAGGPSVELHIESLNYQKEYAWRSRFDRITSRENDGGLLDQYLSSQIGPIKYAYKKQKRDKRRAQQVQKLQKLQKMGSKPTPPFAYKSPPLPMNFAEINKDLIQRFVKNYTREVYNQDPDIPEQKPIDFTPFSELSKYGFDTFSIFDAVELAAIDQELANAMKDKFSENLVSRFLVNVDISNFLKRQPKEHILTTQDEIGLFQKRLALGEYYDSLRSYSQIPYPHNFKALFCGPKSYVNRIYNQQFKGTLKIVDRLFAIHLEEKQNIPALPEPEDKPDKNLVFTEEAEEAEKARQVEEQLRTFTQDASVLKYDQPLYKSEKLKQNPLLHEQYLSAPKVSPFLQESKPIPFFVGWDHDKRKLIITNRLLISHKALMKTTTLTKHFRKLTQKPTTQNKKTSISLEPKRTRPVVPSGKKWLKLQPQTFSFVTWPVSNVSELDMQNNPFLKKMYITPEDLDPPNEELFAEPPLSEEEEEEDYINEYLNEYLDKYFHQEQEDEVPAPFYDHLPSLAQRVALQNPDKLQTSLAPSRGGFIWPGHEPLKFKSFKQMMTNWGIGFDSK